VTATIDPRAAPSPTDIGATATELASRPGLIAELAITLVPRRVGVALAMLSLLGGYSRDKVQTLLSEVQMCRLKLAEGLDLVTMFDAARALLNSVARLEAAVLTLVAARAKNGIPLAREID